MRYIIALSRNLETRKASNYTVYGRCLSFNSLLLYSVVLIKCFLRCFQLSCDWVLVRRLSNFLFSDSTFRISALRLRVLWHCRLLTLIECGMLCSLALLIWVSLLSILMLPASLSFSFSIWEPYDTGKPVWIWISCWLGFSVPRLRYFWWCVLLLFYWVFGFCVWARLYFL